MKWVTFNQFVFHSLQRRNHGTKTMSLSMKNSKNIRRLNSTQKICVRLIIFSPKILCLYVATSNTKKKFRIRDLTYQPLSVIADAFECVQFPEFYCLNLIRLQHNFLTYTEISADEKHNDERDVYPLWSTHDGANLDIYPSIWFFLFFCLYHFQSFSKTIHIKFSIFLVHFLPKSSIIFLIIPHFKSLFSSFGFASHLRPIITMT